MLDDSRHETISSLFQFSAERTPIPKYRSSDVAWRSFMVSNAALVLVVDTDRKNGVGMSL
jgi:hypothetical protein